MANIIKQAAKAAKEGVQIISDTAQKAAARAREKQIEDRFKKFNPVFPNEYLCADFNIPNVIRIVDDAVRRDIDVCEGAMGWRSNEQGIEIFHLYDEAIALSNLHFLPAATCDTIYCVDPYNRNRYFSIDSYFAQIQKAQLAELEHIAFALGAKYYQVKMKEEESKKKVRRAKGNINAAHYGSGDVDVEQSDERTAERKSLASAKFSGGRKPSRPTLCWFAHDDQILNLIDMRCSLGSTGFKEKYLEIKNSRSVAISSNTVAKVNAAAKSMKIGSTFNAKDQHKYNSTLIYEIVFE